MTKPLSEARRDAPQVPAEGLVHRLKRELAPHDYVVALYLASLTTAALLAPPDPLKLQCIQEASALLFLHLVVVLVVRGRLSQSGILQPLVYRLDIWGTVQISYFMFATFLPVVNPDSLDSELYALDLYLFGIEPAMWMERIVTPFTTEWFAFFYFGYFFLLALHVVPLLFFGRDQRLVSEFTLGMVLVFSIGHIGYILVPGFGPYRAMAEMFTREFPSGVWVDLVMAAVEQGGAQKDIFPSLHTAGPTFVTLLSFRHRHKMPFRYSWPVVAFCTVNIIGATMFLRWHYIIDVIAGLALALTGFALCVILTDRELVRRQRAGASELWPKYQRMRQLPAEARS